MIDPRNIRRQSTTYKVTRTIARAVFWVVAAILAGLVFAYTFDPALNPFI